MSLPPDARIGAVELTVMDLANQLRFYEGVLGAKVLSRDATSADLGCVEAASAETGRGVRHVLVKLVEDPKAAPRPWRSTGLYHMAIVLPTRADLGRLIEHLVRKKWPLQGASDHDVSEALYLADAEGNGIEVYADRPRAEWTRLQDRIQMGVAPMDVDAVIAEGGGAPWTGMPEGTRVGHVHLQVADVPAAEAFYRDAIGFDVQARMGDAASFLSAGGYHHHVGLNSWQSRGAAPPPPHSTGLREFEIVVPDAKAVEAVAARLHERGIAHDHDEKGVLSTRDPSGNVVRVTAL